MVTATIRCGGGRSSDTRGEKYSTLRAGARSVRVGGEAGEPGQPAAGTGGGGLLHPRADAVSAELFAHGGFFLAADKVQVKYEMLRAHLLDGASVTVRGSRTLHTPLTSGY